jgi:site-specific DNA-methyltransferase (adenine-specific)
MEMRISDKKYNIIYADPPWSYKDKANAGKRGASHKYKTQSEDWIADLPVPEIAADDCALFLWATMPHLPSAIMTMMAWGFEYKTTAFTWVKKNKVKDSWFMGMGNWTRANAEVCLLGINGKPKRISASVRSVIDAPIGKHSEKPPETRDRIVQLLGDLPRIELFARQTAPGWDAWGDEI